MALNFTVSYSFSPSTTISSSQVNTNTTDVANVFTGLEAVTKSFARLQVDAAPTVAADVVRKDYVDHYSAYRRPVLQYASGTVVNMETGINGTSGQAQIQFPDGNLRTDSTTGRINCNLAQVAALSGSWQSGVRTGTVAANTWYAIYAVKASDDTAKFVAVADTVLPLVANFATLNSNFGTNSWVYLGMITYGDNSVATTAIIDFVQCGNVTLFKNAAFDIGSGDFIVGKLLVSSASATSVTYTYSGGTGSATSIPQNLTHIVVHAGRNSPGADKFFFVSDQVNNTREYVRFNSSAVVAARFNIASVEGVIVHSETTAVKLGATLAGFYDAVLGVGSNPLL